MPPQIPIAAPRLSGGNASLISASVSGSSTAAPEPWITRPAISTPADGASAATAEPATNVTSPATYILRRPNRSPSAAPVSIRQPKARLYALIVHSRSARLAPRCACMVGRAVATTTMSSAEMNAPIPASASVQPGRPRPGRSGREPAVPARPAPVVRTSVIVRSSVTDQPTGRSPAPVSR